MRRITRPSASIASTDQISSAHATTSGLLRQNQIDYYYTSRLKGEPAQGMSDIHFHPVEPRSFRVTLTANF